MGLYMLIHIDDVPTQCVHHWSDRQCYLHERFRFHSFNTSFEELEPADQSAFTELHKAVLQRYVPDLHMACREWFKALETLYDCTRGPAVMRGPF